MGSERRDARVAQPLDRIRFGAHPITNFENGRPKRNSAKLPMVPQGLYTERALQVFVKAGSLESLRSMR